MPCGAMTSAAAPGIEHSLADRGSTSRQKDPEQQDQVQQTAQAIEAAPNRRHDSQRPRAIVTIHSLLPCDVELTDQQH